MAKIEIEFANGPPEDESGRKLLTFENLLEPDPASTVVSGLRIAGLPPLDAAPWPERQHLILRPRLSSAVPRDIVSVFRSGQAAMAFGYYYFPMYELGCGQVLRAFDRAVVSRAQREGCTQPKLMLSNALVYLRKHGVLSEDEFKRLEPLRDLRNQSAHPQFQPYVPAGLALWTLDDVATEIERLVGDLAAR